MNLFLMTLVVNQMMKKRSFSLVSLTLESEKNNSLLQVLGGDDEFLEKRG